MSKLLNLKFIVTLLAMSLVQWALLTDQISDTAYSTLLSLAVGGFMALEWLGNKAQG